MTSANFSSNEASPRVKESYFGDKPNYLHLFTAYSAADTPLRVIATCHQKEMAKAELEGPHGIEVLYENQTT